MSTALPVELAAVADRATVVTGVAGFVGSHVAEALLDLGFTVTGIDHCRGHAPAVADRNLAPLAERPRFHLLRADLAEMALEPLLDGVDTVRAPGTLAALASRSSSMPRPARPAQTPARTAALCSPMPAVKTRASTGV